jgi:hypothetical protein
MADISQYKDHAYYQDDEEDDGATEWHNPHEKPASE